MMALNKLVCMLDGPQHATIAGSRKELWFRTMLNGQMRRTLACSVASRAIPFGTRTATKPQKSESKTSITPQPSKTTPKIGTAKAGKVLSYGGSNTMLTIQSTHSTSSTTQISSTKKNNLSSHPKPVAPTVLYTDSCLMAV